MCKTLFVYIYIYNYYLTVIIYDIYIYVFVKWCNTYTCIVFVSWVLFESCLSEEFCFSTQPGSGPWFCRNQCTKKVSLFILDFTRVHLPSAPGGYAWRLRADVAFTQTGAHPASSVYFKVASFQFFLLYRGGRTSGIFHKVIILDVAGVAASRYQGVIFQIHYATSWSYHDWIISWCLEVFSVSLWRADTGEPNMIGTWVKSMKATGERLSSFTDEAPVIGFRCGSFSNNLQGKNSTFHRKTVR